MVRFSSLAFGICLSIGGIATAVAEDDGAGPRSLRMRPKGHIAPRSHASQGQRPGPARGKQLAQAPAADPPADRSEPAAGEAGEPPVAAASGTELAPLTSTGAFVLLGAAACLVLAPLALYFALSDE